MPARAPWRPIACAFLAGTPLLIHVVLTSHVVAWLEIPLSVGSGLTHATLYGALLVLFARSLRTGGDDLVTGLARRFQNPLPPCVAAYTRGVTLAWCGFFALQLAGSATLLAVAPRAVWSLFVNVLDLPLVGLMFVAEFGCRRLLLRAESSVGLLEAIRAFSTRDDATLPGPS